MGLGALERAGYLAHAGAPVFARRVEASLAAIHHALARVPGTWAVGCSGGKDSTVLLDLCVSAGWRGPVFHFYYAETPPENTALVAMLAARFDLPLHTVAVPGAFDIFEHLGYWFARPETSEQRAATREMLAGYKAAADGAAAEAGYVGLFWGLRAQESRARALSLARSGELYQTADRTTWTCCPLRRWQGRDVWAYLVSRDLPWLSTYDLAMDRERQRSEVTWLAAESLWRHGQAARIRMESPALWARLVQRFPELAREC